MQPARRKRSVEDDLFDQVDVPAAVVCAMCGNADCPGCANELSRSGVVAMVAWERPGAPFFNRLWGTARATTFDADRFFESLPDGPIAPAFRFAVICELLAASAMVAAAVPLLVVIAPTWLRHLAVEEAGLIARLLVVGVPGLAGLLVAAHAAHGYALHHGAKKMVPTGKSASRAVRFGLYAAGWDLVIGPLGAVIVALKEGLFASFKVMTAAVGLPGRSARAFLRGAYRLEGTAAERPLRSSYVAAVIATIIATIAVLSAVIVAALI